MSVSEVDDKSYEIIQGICAICHDDEGYADNPIVFCDRCDTSVHQLCYGVESIPDGHWYCDPCRSHSRNATAAQCILCPEKKGGLKMTNDRRWVHVQCAAYQPEVYITLHSNEPVKLDYVTTNHVRESGTQSAEQPPCSRCERFPRSILLACEGVRLVCQHSQCQTAYHTTCAQYDGLLNREVLTSLVMHDVQLNEKFYCEKHS